MRDGPIQRCFEYMSTKQIQNFFFGPCDCLGCSTNGPLICCTSKCAEFAILGRQLWFYSQTVCLGNAPNLIFGRIGYIYNIMYYIYI